LDALRQVRLMVTGQDIQHAPLMFFRQMVSASSEAIDAVCGDDAQLPVVALRCKLPRGKQPPITQRVALGNCKVKG